MTVATGDLCALMFVVIVVVLAIYEFTAKRRWLGRSNEEVSLWLLAILLAPAIIFACFGPNENIRNLMASFALFVAIAVFLMMIASRKGPDFSAGKKNWAFTPFRCWQISDEDKVPGFCFFYPQTIRETLHWDDRIFPIVIDYKINAAGCSAKEFAEAEKNVKTIFDNFSKDKRIMSFDEIYPEKSLLAKMIRDESFFCQANIDFEIKICVQYIKLVDRIVFTNRQ